MYRNDINQEIHSNKRHFGDDPRLYIVVNFHSSAAQILNLDLKRLCQLVVQWFVKFNTNITESLSFSRRIFLLDYPTLSFTDVSIQEVSSHKP